MSVMAQALILETQRSSDALTMDRSELERELERLHAECWGWALACTGRDRALAEDALQTAYLRVLSGQGRFDGRSRFKSWLFGVIRLTAMEELRRANRWREGEDGGAMASVVDPTPGVDVMTEQAERNAALVAAMATVSPRQREVLQLVFYHGLTIEEAAGVMGVSVGSARTHYERGKKALAGQINEVDVR
jgi:RNA polymerase sigma-70 factor (ECF subfamily)